MTTAESRRLAKLCLHLAHLVRGEIKCASIKPCFSEIQIHALLFTMRHEPHLGDLASHLAITPPSTTALVKSLSAQGLVTQRKDARDHRASGSSSRQKAGSSSLRGSTSSRRALTTSLTSSIRKTEKISQASLNASSHRSQKAKRLRD